MNKNEEPIVYVTINPDAAYEDGWIPGAIRSVKSLGFVDTILFRQIGIILPVETLGAMHAECVPEDGEPFVAVVGVPTYDLTELKDWVESHGAKFVEMPQRKAIDMFPSPRSQASWEGDH